MECQPRFICRISAQSLRNYSSITVDRREFRDVILLKNKKVKSTHARTSSAPQRADDVLPLRLLDALALFRILRHKEQERHAPDRADRAEDVEDGRPAAGEAVG